MLLGRLLGVGNTAEVFEIEDQAGDVLKLFFENVAIEHIKKEYATSEVINRLEIATSKTKELVEHQNRWGIVYEKVTGPSLTHLLSTRPYALKNMATAFAGLHASFHGKQATELPSQKVYLSRSIKGSDLLTKEEIEVVLTFLDELPEGDSVCHMDFHPDNVVLMDGAPMVLDWMTGTAGNPCADVARTLLILRYAVLPASMPWTTRQLVNGVRKAFTNSYWKAYVKETGMTEECIEAWTLPLMAARLNEGIPELEKKWLVKEIRRQLGQKSEL